MESIGKAHRPNSSDDAAWRKIRNALWRRLESFDKRGDALTDYSDREDATQDAFIRLCDMLEKHPSRSIGWCIHNTCLYQRQYCSMRPGKDEERIDGVKTGNMVTRYSAKYGYRPIFEPKKIKHGHWSLRIDNRRIHTIGPIAIGDATRRASQGLPMNVDESKLLAEYPNRMRIYFEGGIDATELGRQFGLGRHQVMKYAKLYGWKKQAG